MILFPNMKRYFAETPQVQVNFVRNYWNKIIYTYLKMSIEIFLISSAVYYLICSTKLVPWKWDPGFLKTIWYVLGYCEEEKGIIWKKENVPEYKKKKTLKKNFKSLYWHFKDLEWENHTVMKQELSWSNLYFCHFIFISVWNLFVAHEPLQWVAVGLVTPWVLNKYLLESK